MPPLLLLSLLIGFDALLATPAIAESHSTSLRAPLHRSLPPLGAATRLDYVRELVKSDLLRQRMIAGTIGGHRYRQPRRACENATTAAAESFAMPLSSGAYTHTGQYFVRFRLGTPARRFVLVADTGSDLTWVKCRFSPRRCRHCRGGGGGGGARPFRPEKSVSFDPIRCSTDLCKTSLPFSLSTCPSPASPCAYNYGYADGSMARGIYATESATVMLSNGQKVKLKGMIIGCTSSFAGSSFRASDGVLGLGHSGISFASRVTARFGGRFSYCLVDHLSPKNVSSYLIFGSNGALAPSAARQTELLMEPRLAPFYSVGVSGISVDGEVLKIPMSVWDVGRRGGAILDSGTSLTVLVEPAYKAVVSALSRRLAGVPRVDLDPFEYCYNWTDGTKVTIPKLVVHFHGPARLEPPAKSYVIDVADGVKCIGFTSAPWPGVSTIGNILQQEHLWEFDVKNRRLRFQRSTCAPH
ncbi:aspartic proteinase NANA, chloroplast-like [Phoenix dactylifera]|uniref:Aspartic proteinase NANA, chloroplast-like n=1 Tax=Phoenix dactylifera TaxID=42345 RepID=A0A8B7CLH9_PHODC|nr:aspartic proteinase NANA, chloroplast-like [Phoenix dactylifera]